MTEALAVLYAEDDENDAFFMQRAFAKLGRPGALRVVPNGTEAVAYLAATPSAVARPGLVLLDVKMPEMSGLETLAWIRARPEFNPLPVVMFTSSTQESDVSFSRTNGANGYVVKPSNADRLSHLVAGIVAAIDGGPVPGRLPFPDNLI